MVVDKLYMPTTVTHEGAALPLLFSRNLFPLIRSNAGAVVVRKDVVFVMHVALTSNINRCLANQEEVAQRLKEIGVTIYSPADHTLADQVSTFSSARLVIGQDSSSLHNLIFSDADCIVIETEPRGNIVHCSIQDANDRKISYISAKKCNDERYRLDNQDIDFIVRFVKENYNVKI